MPETITICTPYNYALEGQTLTLEVSRENCCAKWRFLKVDALIKNSSLTITGAAIVRSLRNAQRESELALERLEREKGRTQSFLSHPRYNCFFEGQGHIIGLISLENAYLTQNKFACANLVRERRETAEKKQNEHYFKVQFMKRSNEIYVINQAIVYHQERMQIYDEVMETLPPRLMCGKTADGAWAVHPDKLLAGQKRSRYDTPV